MKRKSAVFFLLTFFSFCCLLYSSVSKGNYFYKKGKIDQALEEYKEAEIKYPDSPVVNYNLGNALHKKQNYEDALKEYNKALNTKDKELESKIYYNTGNTFFRMQKYQEALFSYKKCLEINPDDKDAKYNIEFLLKNLQSNTTGQHNQGRNNQNQQQKNQQMDNKSKQQGQQKQHEEKKSMSKEDAERLLQMFEQQDKENIKKNKQKIKIPQIKPSEYDW